MNMSPRGVMRDEINGFAVLLITVTSVLLSKVRCTHIITFINLLGHLLMERHTIKVTIF
jgi:hypothetical protein